MRMISIATFIGIAAAFTLTLSAQNLEVELQRAEQKEMATADLKAAINEYQSIASRAGTNRTVAVRALLRMAEAHEKLGNEEARKIYQQIVKEYSDQQALVSTARDRLNASNVSKFVSRRVWSVPPQTRVGRVSPDGRYVGFSRASDLMIRDLVTGTERSVIHLDSGRVGPTMAWSPNGRRIAFEAGGNGGTELRSINIDGSDMRTLTTPAPWARVLDYFPDGERVLASRAQGNDSQVFAVRVSDGSTQDLVLRPGPGGSGWPRLSPDGRFVALRSSSTVSLLATDGSGEIVIPGPALNPAGWSPDGRHLLFLRTEAGRIDLWIAPVADGKPSGSPELVYLNFGTISAIEIAIVENGSLYYVKSGAEASELHVIEKLLPPGKGR